MRVAIVMGLLAVFAAAGCSTVGNGAPPAEESREWRLQSLEKHFLEFQEEQRGLRAELEERMGQWEQRMADLDTNVAAIRQDTAALHTEVLALKSELRARNQSGVQPEAARGAEEEQAAAQPAQRQTTQQPQTAKRAPAPAGMGLYRKGLELTRAGKTEQAREKLNEFLEEHPDSPLAPNALYWLGETYYHDKRYGQSILTFKDVSSRFPQHDKAAAALLKIGYSYDRLGDASNARFYLQTLVDDYPQSEPARLARDKLQLTQ